MKILYILSTVFSRLFGLFALLLLAHLMGALDFGEFNILLTNVLLVSTVTSSWISSAAYRLIPGLPEAKLHQSVASIGAALAFISIVTTSIIILTGAITGNTLLLAVFSLVVVATSMFDVSLAILNATSAAKSYMISSMVRGLITLMMGPIVYLVSRSIVLTLMCYSIAALVPIITSAQLRRLLTQSFRAGTDITFFRSMFIQGWLGSTTVMLYLIVSGASRNALAIFADTTQSGQWALVSDLFWGPLAVVTSAISLTWMPRLFKQSAGSAEFLKAATQLMNITIFLTVPYAICGAIIAPTIAEFVAPNSFTQVGLFAPAAVITSALLSTLSAALIIFLAASAFRVLVISSIAVVFLPSIVLVCVSESGGSVVSALWATCTCLGIVLAFVLTILINSRLIKFRIYSAFNGLAPLLPAVFVTRVFDNTIWGAGFAIVCAAATYLIIARLFRVESATQMFVR